VNEEGWYLFGKFPPNLGFQGRKSHEKWLFS